MTERIHDDEPNISEVVVRALLQAECPDWADAPLTYLKTSGTDNAMWRLHMAGDSDLVVRLPRRPGAARGMRTEASVLLQLESVTLADKLQTPIVRHAGAPQDCFPHPWLVLDWLPGNDEWTCRQDLGTSDRTTLTLAMGRLVCSIGSLRIEDVGPRNEGDRGGRLSLVLDRLESWLDDPVWNADSLVDLAAVRRCIAESREAELTEPASRFVHGDLLPGNLLLANRELSAVIDWGNAAYGDPAQDLSPAWSMFTATERPVFREAAGADDETWVRARGFELEHAVGGVLYYRPRNHPLADVMEWTLQQILNDR